MRKNQSAQSAVLKRTEAYVRDALETSKKKPSQATIKAVAKKIVKAMPQHVLEHA
jgi:hypothetical protein